MLVRTITRLTAATALAMTLAACGDTETDTAAADETEAAADEGGPDAEADAATAEGSDASAADQDEAAAPWVGAWVEDGPDAGQLELRADGTALTNEPSLPEGTWEEEAGGIVVTFAGRNTVRMPGRMEGDVLVLTAPDGEVGRFVRASGGSSGGSGESSGGKPD